MMDALINLGQVSVESANQFGELVADPVTNELLHYTEKPETFVCNTSEEKDSDILLLTILVDYYLIKARWLHFL